MNVEYLDPAKKVLMLSADGMSLAFESSEAPLQGRISIGVKGINMEDGDSVVFAGQFAQDDVATACTSDGYLKKIACKNFALSSRYRKGLKYFALNSGAKVGYACLNDISSIIAVDFGLKILPLETKKFKLSERLTAGELIIKKKFLGAYLYC